MAEMTFRIPSRTVQYGYVEIPFEYESGIEAEMLAAHYVSFVYAFQKEEEATVKRLAEGVSAPEKLSKGATEEQAKRMLDEGLGGVTEVPDEVSEVSSNAPWNSKVDSQPKPWETGETVLKGPPAIIDSW